MVSSLEAQYSTSIGKGKGKGKGQRSHFILCT